MAARNADDLPRESGSGEEPDASRAAPIIKVRQIGGVPDKVIRLPRNPTEISVLDLKRIVSASLGLSIPQIRLIFLGKVLRPDTALCGTFGIFHGCVVHLLPEKYVTYS